MNVHLPKALVRFCLTALLCTSLTSLTRAQLRADDANAQFEAYMKAAVEADRFSGSVLVAKDGKIIFQNGYGLANAEHGVPNTPDTKFRLGSITKQFTATAILILQDREKLKVDDPISKYFSDPPDAWSPVTIHHLLSHTSGVPSYTEDFVYGMQMFKPETVPSMIARFREKPLAFEPGSQFHYSNSGYFLLGAIIEKVSGQSYEDFLRENIFDPLEMKDTGYDRYQTVLSKRASGYERRGDQLVNAPYLDMSQPFAAGSLYSTVGDLYRWDRALKEGKILSKESMELMFKPVKNNYAYGWSVGEGQGRKFVGHGGGINGFATDFLRYPDQDVCVAVLTNVVPSNPSKVSRALARIAFGENVSLPKVRTVAKIDPKIYDDYVGKYQLSPGVVLTVTREGEKLMAQPTGQNKAEIYPESESEFFLKIVDAQLKFVRENDRVSHVLLTQNDQQRKADRVEDTPSADAVQSKRDVAYVEPKNERQTLDVFFQADTKDRPIIFWIHGGGWQAGDKSDVQVKPESLVGKGFVFVSTNYRLIPDVTIHEMAGDIAKGIRWIREHATEFGGDPSRVFVMGHSAGAQLAALVCTDHQFLEAEGISPKVIRGCVPVDGDSYDVPMQIAAVEERRAAIYKRKFGDEEQQKALSSVNHIVSGKNIPPFLILHVADHPETKAQSQRLATALKDAGIAAQAFPAAGKTHETINSDLGTSNDEPTKALYEFLDEALNAERKE